MANWTRTGIRRATFALLMVALVFGGMLTSAWAEGIEVVAQEEATSDEVPTSLGVDAAADDGGDNVLRAAADDGLPVTVKLDFARPEWQAAAVFL